MDISFNYDRVMASKALAEAYSERFNLSPQEINKRLAGWQIIGLVLSGDLIGAVCIKGNEGHIGIKKQYRAKWGGAKALAELCKYFGVNRTVVMHLNTRSMKLLERYGWQRKDELQNGVVYELS